MCRKKVEDRVKLKKKDSMDPETQQVVCKYCILHMRVNILNKFYEVLEIKTATIQILS